MALAEMSGCASTCVSGLAGSDPSCRLEKRRGFSRTCHGEFRAIGRAGRSCVAAEGGLCEADAAAARTPLEPIERGTERREKRVVRIGNATAQEDDLGIEDIDKARQSCGQGTDGAQPNGGRVRRAVSEGLHQFARGRKK